MRQMEVMIFNQVREMRTCKWKILFRYFQIAASSELRNHLMSDSLANFSQTSNEKNVKPYALLQKQAPYSGI